MPSSRVTGTQPQDRARTTSSLLSFDQAALYDVTDPWSRSRLADELAKQLRELTALVLKVRSDAVGELVTHGARRVHVAQHLGVTRGRISQLVNHAKLDGGEVR